MAGSTARRGVDGVAGVLRVIGMLIVAVLVLHILLGVLEANPANTFASTIAELAALVDLGLNDLFTPADPKLALLLNYGAATLAWLLITTVAVRLVQRLG